MRAIVGLSFIASVAIIGWVCPATASTLCKADEVVVFSCPTRTNIASLCASKNASDSGGYMQYRFGRKNRLDLSYPPVSARPADVFASGTAMFSGGGSAWLSFKRAPFSYTIFTASGRWGPSGSAADAAGVAVQKGGKEFANFPCRAAPGSEIGPELFEKLGLKEADPTKRFDIPQAFFPKPD